MLEAHAVPGRVALATGRGGSLTNDETGTNDSVKTASERIAMTVDGALSEPLCVHSYLLLCPYEVCSSGKSSEQSTNLRTKILSVDPRPPFKKTCALASSTPTAPILRPILSQRLNANSTNGMYSSAKMQRLRRSTFPKAKDDDAHSPQGNGTPQSGRQRRSRNFVSRYRYRWLSEECVRLPLLSSTEQLLLQRS